MSLEKTRLMIPPEMWAFVDRDTKTILFGTGVELRCEPDA